MISQRAQEVKGRGFILRLTPAQEADVIVNILTATGDKVSAFARAGLKSRKRFGGALEPLLHVDYRMTCKSGRDLFYLEETQIIHDFRNIKKQIERLASASYLAELVEHSAQEGLEHVEIYDLFGAALRALDAGLSFAGVLRQFEVKLLAILGWLPSLNRCGRCEVGGRTMSLDPHQGLVLCQDCGGQMQILISQDLQETLSYLLRTSILKSQVNSQILSSLEKVTSTLLSAHWGNRRLKSADFLKSVSIS